MDLLNKNIAIGFVLSQEGTKTWQQDLFSRLQNQGFKNLYFADIPNKIIEKSLFFSLYQKLDQTLFGFKCVPNANFVVQKKTEQKKIVSVDILINLTDTFLDKDWQKKSKNGIWQVFFPQNPIEHLQFAGWQECFADKLCIGMAIQAVTEQNIYTISYAECYNQTLSPTINQNQIYWKTGLLFERSIKKFAKNGFLDQIALERQFETQKKVDFGNFKMIKFAFKQFSKIFLKLVENFIYINDYWIIIFNLEGNSHFSNWKKLLPPKNAFWADPFIIKDNNQTYLFIEECFLGQKGHLSVMTLLENNTWSLPKIILKKEYHLSYPFVFKYQNEFYMIPESAENATVELYKATNFPEKWEFQMNLMEGIIACDTTLFFHENTWWLFANVMESKQESSWEELYLFYSDDLFSKKWHKHPQNPIISDVASSRPAGNIFIEDGKIIRPSQNSSKRYGYGICLNQIITINKTEYKEVLYKKIIPNWNSKMKTIHTINTEDNIQVADTIFLRNRFF